VTLKVADGFVTTLRRALLISVSCAGRETVAGAFWPDDWTFVDTSSRTMHPPGARSIMVDLLNRSAFGHGAT
jgi:hypothetical protein